MAARRSRITSTSAQSRLSIKHKPVDMSSIETVHGIAAIESVGSMQYTKIGRTTGHYKSWRNVPTCRDRPLP